MLHQACVRTGMDANTSYYFNVHCRNVSKVSSQSTPVPLIHPFSFSYHECHHVRLCHGVSDNMGSYHLQLPNTVYAKALQNRTTGLYESTRFAAHWLWAVHGSPLAT